ncbi:MAG: hypothetical protein IJ946_01950 [Clostridia bacterium]|nr:hypothetical protein [Clostridia bacterium]
MKKIVAVFCVFLIVLSLSCCGREDISAYIETESDSGKRYIVCPVSGTRVSVYREFEIYLEDISPSLLKAADEKLSSDLAEAGGEPYYSGVEPYYYLRFDDEGYLCLCVETIVKKESQLSTSIGDHEHLFFTERITKESVE